MNIEEFEKELQNRPSLAKEFEGMSTEEAYDIFMLALEIITEDN